VKFICSVILCWMVTANNCWANAFTQDTKNTDYSTISLFRDGQPYRDVGEALAQYPKINYETKEQAEKIKRGEYLVKIGDCIGCHTEKNGPPFAGGLGFDTPFGRVYSPNITPNKKKGIGRWTLKKFNYAVRQGIAPSHEYLYPAFPYLYFNKITDQDLSDMKAYLDAIPAVSKKNKKNALFFPFNLRFLQIGWRLLFFDFLKTNEYKYNDKQTPNWNRGAYLVQALGHCDMCHTPMVYFINPNWVLGAPIRRKHLSGAFVSGFYAPNITNLWIKNVSRTEFQNIFWKKNLVEGGPVEGPMYQVIHDSLQYLKPEDVEAISVYLFSVKSGVPHKPKFNLNANDAGEKIYDQYCRQCHQTGKGPIPNAPALDDTAEWKMLKKFGVEQLYQYAWHGLDGMPIRGTCMDCTYDEIKETVQYMLQTSIPPENDQGGS
jgi:cytochrome c5